ncbi:DinB family protein [Sphingobacterium suaedae]|uniref:DinB family protein n=1 Tax=Sphingobacterium suaedae TaxID=1686402 RepID=A0ABW5KAR9_9SPHI
MGIKKSLLIELERETQNTRRVLECLSDEHLLWRPHPKSMSVAELCCHVVELHNWVSEALVKSVFDFKVDYKRLQTNSIQEIRDILEAGYPLNKQAIENASDESWEEEWTLQAGDWIIAKVPKAGAIRFIINNHIIHHRGQLTVYLRLLDIPVPGLYGPSADDQQ